MKAKLEFNLPEENEEFQVAVDGWRYKSIIWELDSFLRSKLKYENLQEKEYEIFDKVRSHLWELIKEENITIY